MGLISRIPMTAERYYDELDVKAYLATVQNLRANYGPSISQAATLANVPAAVIESVCFIESAGVANARSSAGAVGLMQLTPDTCVTVIHLDYKAGRISTEQATVLSKYLGAKLSNIKKLRYLGDPKAGDTSLTASMVQPPEVNLLIGAMLLGRLIDQSTDLLSVTDKLIRWDKVIVRYNAGYFYKLPAKAKTVSDVMAEAKKKSSETYNYITKFVGKNGVLVSLT